MGREGWGGLGGGGGGLNLISGNLYGVSGRGEARLRLCCSCCTRDLTNLVIMIIVFVIIVIMIIANRMRIFMCSYGVQHLAI